MIAIGDKLDHDSLISVSHLGCSKLKMERSSLPALISQSIAIERSGHLYAISNPISIEHFGRNRTTIIQIELHIKLISLHHITNRQAHMLLINPAFSSYGDGNLRVLEFIEGGREHGDEGVGWDTVGVAAVGGLQGFFKVAFYHAV
jgi:hypothetical protein